MTPFDGKSAEARLAALWARDEAPEVDPAFERAISVRIGRRQILREVGEVMVWAIPAAAVTWAVWPSLTSAAQPLMQGVIQIGPMLVIIASTLFALWSATRLLHLPGFDLGAFEGLLPRGHMRRGPPGMGRFR